MFIPFHLIGKLTNKVKSFLVLFVLPVPCKNFGINDIADLPKPKEIDEIMGKLDQEEGISESIIETLTETESFEDESNHKDDSAQ